MLKSIGNFFLYLVLIVSPLALFAQDTITTKTGANIRARVLEIRIDDIKYKLYDSTNSRIYFIKKSDIQVISYQDGSKDYFSVSDFSPPATAQPSPLQGNTPPSNSPNNTSTPDNTRKSSLDMYHRGIMDADRYYRGYRVASTATFITAAIASPLFGLALAVPCSLTAPSHRNISRHCPQRDLLSNPDYYRGYEDRAWRIKSRKVWTSYGIGSALFLAYIYL